MIKQIELLLQKKKKFWVICIICFVKNNAYNLLIVYKQVILKAFQEPSCTRAEVFSFSKGAGKIEFYD